jgi:hypothetical protein
MNSCLNIHWVTKIESNCPSCTGPLHPGTTRDSNAHIRTTRPTGKIPPAAHIIVPQECQKFAHKLWKYRCIDISVSLVSTLGPLFRNMLEPVLRKWWPARGPCEFKLARVIAETSWPWLAIYKFMVQKLWQWKPKNASPEGCWRWQLLAERYQGCRYSLDGNKLSLASWRVKPWLNFVWLGALTVYIVSEKEYPKQGQRYFIWMGFRRAHSIYLTHLVWSSSLSVLRLLFAAWISHLHTQCPQSLLPSFPKQSSSCCAL